MNRFRLSFLWVAAALQVFVCAVHAVEVNGQRDERVGSIRLNMVHGDERNHLEIVWGGDGAGRVSEGALVKFTATGTRKPVEVKLSDAAVDRLFGVAAKMAARQPVPRTFTGQRSSKDMFQLYIVNGDGQLGVNFPANEPALWNHAAAGWKVFAEVLKKEAELTLAAAKPVQEEGSAPAVGLGRIQDYTSLEIVMNRVRRGSNMNYGDIHAKWVKARDGKISFTARYYPRMGDGAKADADVAKIRPVFEKLQKLVKGYRMTTTPKGKKLVASDYMSVSIKVAGQPGDVMMYFPATDASQWGEADQLWGLLVELFAKEDQGKIVQ